MADTRGTFRLKDVRQDILNDEYVSIPSVFVDPSIPQVTTAGYFIGGSTNSPYVAMSNIDKLTYANDTISTPPTASGFGRYTAPAPYNYYDYMTYANNGAFALFTNYHICNTPSPAPVMYKHDFSTDDVTTVPSLAPVFPSAGGRGGAGTAETAWWHASTGSPGQDAIKITYSTASYAALPSGTGFSSNGLGSATRIFQNQLVAGYTPASAPSNPGASQVKKLTFTTDTFTDNGWTLNSNRNNMAAVDAGSDDNTGLVAGGSSSPSPSNAVEKITLNSSTVSSAPSLSGGRYGGAAHSSGSGGSGYFSAMSSGGGPTADISKVPFSSYSFSSIPATLSSIRRNCRGYSGLSKALKAGMSASIERWFDSAKPGAFAVNFDGSGDRLSLASHADLQIGSSDYTIEFWVYKNADTPDDYDCWAAKGSNNSNTREFAIESMQDQTIDWYYATSGGTWITAQNVSNGAIPTSQWVHIVAQKGDGSGYFSFYVDGVRKYYSTTGGQTLNTGGDQFCIAGFADYNTVFEANVKISNFRFVKGTAVYSGSSFTVPTEPLGNITNTKLLCCNQSTTTGATVKPGTITAHGDPTVSDDSTVPLNQPPAATPTASSTPQSPAPAPQIAYHMAGRTPAGSGTSYSSCGKIVFTTETSSALPGSNIPARRFCGGTGSATAAYCFGGSNTIAKLLYSTDAASTLPSTLPAGYKYKCAVSNDTIAYTFGGYQPDYSIIDKLTFSNDTVSANTPTSRPDTIRNSCGHFSSPTKGYFSTGANYYGGTPASRKTHYITFATDSGSSAPEHPSPRNSIFSCGNATHAYTTGGRGPDSSSPREQSNTAKFTYSNETWSNVPGAPLSARTYYGDGAATQTFGYFSGGSTGGSGPAVKSTSRKFNFASETMGSGASLSVPKWGFGFAASTESNHPQTTPQPNIPHVI